MSTPTTRPAHLGEMSEMNPVEHSEGEHRQAGESSRPEVVQEHTDDLLPSSGGRLGMNIGCRFEDATCFFAVPDRHGYGGEISLSSPGTGRGGHATSRP